MSDLVLSKTRTSTVLQLAKQFLISLRPKQWIKNFFVVAPLFFSQNLHDISIVFHVIIAFFIFCIFSGIVYLLNDIIDLEIDRKHPKKSKRPLAAGLITKNTVAIVAVFLMIVSIFGSLWLGNRFLYVGLSYLLLNIFYSLLIKNVVILDVISIAIGFALRLVAGGIVVEVPASHWSLMSTIFLALFLGFGKRKGEILLLQKYVGESTRSVSKKYSIQLLDQFILISAAGAIMSYSLSTVSEHAFTRFGTYNLIYTTPFVLFGIFRYLFLVQHGEMGDSPTETLYFDKTLMATIALWIVSIIVIIGV